MSRTAPVQPLIIDDISSYKADGKPLPPHTRRVKFVFMTGRMRLQQEESSIDTLGDDPWDELQIKIRDDLEYLEFDLPANISAGGPEAEQETEGGEESGTASSSSSAPPVPGIKPEGEEEEGPMTIRFRHLKGIDLSKWIPKCQYAKQNTGETYSIWLRDHSPSDFKSVQLHELSTTIGGLGGNKVHRILTVLQRLRMNAHISRKIRLSGVGAEVWGKNVPPPILDTPPPMLPPPSKRTHLQKQAAAAQGYPDRVGPFSAGFPIIPGYPTPKAPAPPTNTSRQGGGGGVAGSTAPSPTVAGGASPPARSISGMSHGSSPTPSSGIPASFSSLWPNSTQQSLSNRLALADFSGKRPSHVAAPVGTISVPPGSTSASAAGGAKSKQPYRLESSIMKLTPKQPEIAAAKKAPHPQQGLKRGMSQDHTHTSMGLSADGGIGGGPSGSLYSATAPPTLPSSIKRPKVVGGGGWFPDSSVSSLSAKVPIAPASGTGLPKVGVGMNTGMPLRPPFSSLENLQENGAFRGGPLAPGSDLSAAGRAPLGPVSGGFLFSRATPTSSGLSSMGAALGLPAPVTSSSTGVGLRGAASLATTGGSVVRSGSGGLDTGGVYRHHQSTFFLLRWGRDGKYVIVSEGTFSVFVVSFEGAAGEKKEKNLKQADATQPKTTETAGEGEKAEETKSKAAEDPEEDSMRGFEGLGVKVVAVSSSSSSSSSASPPPAANKKGSEERDATEKEDTRQKIGEIRVSPGPAGGLTQVEVKVEQPVRLHRISVSRQGEGEGERDQKPEGHLTVGEAPTRAAKTKSETETGKPALEGRQSEEGRDAESVVVEGDGAKGQEGKGSSGDLPAGSAVLGSGHTERGGEGDRVRGAEGVDASSSSSSASASASLSLVSSEVSVSVGEWYPLFPWDSLEVGVGLSSSIPSSSASSSSSSSSACPPTTIPVAVPVEDARGEANAGTTMLTLQLEPVTVAALLLMRGRAPPRNTHKHPQMDPARFPEAMDCLRPEPIDILLQRDMQAFGVSIGRAALDLPIILQDGRRPSAQSVIPQRR